MPHLHLAYSANLAVDADHLLVQLNRTLLDTGLFAEADIKSRAQAFEHYLVGRADTASAYAHITLWLLSGRSETTRSAVAQQLLAALQAAIGATTQPLQLTVDVQEINRAVYAKAMLPG